MEKIKLFLKQDSDILRNIVIILFCLPAGIYKLFFQIEQRFETIVAGLIVIFGCIVLTVNIVKEFMRLVNKKN